MKITNAVVDWLDSGLPVSRQFGDIYFCDADEIGESRHVFLAGNDIPSCWQIWDWGQGPFVIGELGFGSGLNFLLTWQAWQQWRQQAPASSGSSSSPRLHYLAFEAYPLTRHDLQRIHNRWPQLADLAVQLQQQYADHSAGCHRLLLAPDICLDLHFGDALERSQRLLPSSRASVNAWFADGFSPSSNPQLWQATLLQNLARLSRPGASLSTYSVAGQVRRDLQQLGFEISKTPGFANKRHMLRAVLRRPTAEPEPRSLAKPWNLLPAFSSSERRAVVVGAGLAGLSMASSLAARGWQVTVLEAGDRVLAGASGHQQLALRCRLMANADALAEYYLQGFLFTRRLLDSLLGPVRGQQWQDCGVLQFQDAINKRKSAARQRLQELFAEQVVRFPEAGELRAIAGLELSAGAAYFPLGAWVDPHALARAWLRNSSIDCHTDSAMTGLHRDSNQWHLTGEEGKNLGHWPVVVLCAGTGLCELDLLNGLPLQPLRGQTTLLASQDSSRQLRTVVCGERTVFPEYQGIHTLGSSYSRDNREPEISVADNHTNLDLARSNFVAGDVLGSTIVGSDVAFRTATPDRAPLVGPLPDFATMKSRFARLSFDASSRFDTAGSYLPGLYVHSGHGSNGLATAPMASEILASMIEGENLPVGDDILDRLNPVRFLIRELKRQQS